MKIAFCFLIFTLFRLMSAQMMPYTITGTNGMVNTASNVPNVITSSGPMAGHGVHPTHISRSSGYIQTPTGMPTGNYLSNTNMANANLINSKPVNINLEQVAAGGPVHANHANAVHGNLANAANANTVANAVNTANAIIAAENVANNIINANHGHEHVLANTEELKQLSNLSPVLNGNMATFYLGNNGNTFTVTSGSPGTQGLGVQVMADALEVGGTVAVNGRIPIYGMVGINGNIPTDGMATVSYSCANPSTLL